MTARGILLAAAAALVALAVTAGASARTGAHRRHVEVRRPTVRADLRLGTHGGYEVGVDFEEPDLAKLFVVKHDESRLGVEETRYGTHFRGSLSGGRVTADFGAVGSLAVRFRPRGPAREAQPSRGCEGRPGRSEAGRWVGRISLRGEGGYFAISRGSAGGELDRTFRLRCHVTRLLPRPRPQSLRERIEPRVGSSLLSLVVGTVASLQAVDRQGGRVIAMRAAHVSGGGPGAEVEAGAFEYQGRIPVGRLVQMFAAPAGSLVTTLPGERPATATVKPGAPFSGTGNYLAISPTTHSWTGTLAVRFPGLVAPLAGTGFYSSLCVISPLVNPHACDLQPPDLQAGGESTTADRRR